MFICNCIWIFCLWIEISPTKWSFVSINRCHAISFVNRMFVYLTDLMFCHKSMSRNQFCKSDVRLSD